MKPFNLKAALAGDPVLTRSGEPVLQLTHFPDSHSFKLAGVVNGAIQTWTEDGLLYGPSSRSDYDLVMAPKKTTMWIAYKAEEGEVRSHCTTHGYRSKEDLLDAIAGVRLSEWTVIPVEVEE